MVRISVLSRPNSPSATGSITPSYVVWYPKIFASLWITILTLGALWWAPLMQPHVIEQHPLLRFDQSSSASSSAQCRFYLAESAIPKAGLGVFTAVDITEGEEAQSFPDICIFMVDTPKGNAFDTHSWGRIVMPGAFEGNRPRAACEGFASLLSHADFARTSHLVRIRQKDNAGLHRRTHPGAGAITQYYGATSQAIRDIPAGSELTIDYGDFKNKPGVPYVELTRSVEWLRQHGWCIDNLDIRPSSDPQMGRGAFAKVALMRGSLVAPAPLQVFPNRSQLTMESPKAESVFVNYCFQIPGTEILLYPYGPGVNLINHSKEPNVGLRWSRSPTSHYSWLDLSFEQFLPRNYPGGIVMEVVALRDIQVGEELFLDYGDDWEAAWNEHVRSWNPPQGAQEYVYPAEMDTTEPFRTLEELATNPYPKNLVTVCHSPRWTRKRGQVIEWYESEHPWPEGLTYCHILSREEGPDGNYLYDVALEWDERTLVPTTPRSELSIDAHVSHEAISFVERKYTSDMNLPSGFRHSMALPSELIPKHWVNAN